MFNKFRQHAIHAHLDITVNSPDKIEIAIVDKNLDAGFVPNYQRLPDLDYKPVYQETRNLYCSNDQPLFNFPDDQLNEQ